MNRDDTLLIIGATSDLGLDLINRLMSGQHSPRILALYQNSQDRIDALVASYGSKITPIRIDLTTEVGSFAKEFQTAYGVPNKILCLAGLPLLIGRISQWDSAYFAKDIQIQVGATAQLLGHLLPVMAKGPHRAKVVFVSSSVTRGMPPKFMSMYTVVKYAQLGLMRSLAAEYAGTQVNINAVTPGMIQTRFLAQVPKIAVELAESSTPFRKNLATGDVNAVIEFLLSSDSDHLMGIDIPITDGAAI